MSIGIETGSLVEFSSTFGAAVESSIVNSGNYSAKLTSSAGVLLDDVITPSDDAVFSFAFRFTDAPSGDVQIGRIVGSSVIQLILYLTSSRTLKLNGTGEASVTGSTVLSTDTWYRIAIRHKKGTGSNAQGEIYLGGVSEGSFSNSTGVQPADSCSARFSTGSGNVYCDDLKMVSGSTVPDQTYKTVALRPNGAGDGDTAFDGDYTDIDDDPINEATYRASTATAATFFDALADVPVDFSTVNAVHVGVWLYGGDGGNVNYIQYKNGSGSAEEAALSPAVDSKT